MTMSDYAGVAPPFTLPATMTGGRDASGDAAGSPETAVRAFMRAMGLPEDSHTVRTPERVVKAWRHRLSGYGENPADHLDTTFPVDGDPGLVSVTGIRFASTCAHHLLPITGTATIAYRPDAERGRVVGLSKLSRVFEGYARRLQVQEQLGAQTIAALVDRLRPVGAVAVITAEHGCMTLRGVQQPGSATTTVSTSGTPPAGGVPWTTGHPDVQAVLAEHRANL